VTLSTTLASTHPWGSDHPLAGLLANIYRISFCLWPLAFLIGVLRAKVAPTEMTRLLIERY
jgi:hypothetical protein